MLVKKADKFLSFCSFHSKGTEGQGNQAINKPTINCLVAADAMIIIRIVGLST